MSDIPAVETSRSTFQSIPIDQIKPSSHQARKDFDEKAIKGLAESMRQEGLIEPIIVRTVSALQQGVTPTPPNADTPIQYELISGERRLRSAKLLGWKTIEAKII